MGIDITSAKLYFLTKIKYNVDFSNIAVLGRQIFLGPGKKDLIKAQRELRNILDTSRVFQEDGYSENFWHFLGGDNSHLDIFDVSDYEGANCIHDMNTPIPQQYIGNYSAVIDGGTLEHVFNYPQGLWNVMSMVKQGGHILLMTPGNQQMGHGFYQLSPLLFNTIFREENGYKLLEISLFESGKSRKRSLSRFTDYSDETQWFQQKTKNEVCLFVVAERIGDVPKVLKASQIDIFQVLSKNNSSERSKNNSWFPKLGNFMSKHSFIGSPYFKLVAIVKGYIYKKKLIYHYDIDKEIIDLINQKNNKYTYTKKK